VGLSLLLDFLLLVDDDGLPPPIDAAAKYLYLFIHV
jgi:hypothetical protein